MKISIKPLVRPIQLGDYAPEYDGEIIYTLVNPDRQTRLEHFDIAQRFDRALDERNRAMKVINASGDEDNARAQVIVEKFNGELASISKELYGWFAALWSHHPDKDTHWTVEEVEALVDACLDSDVELWNWLQQQCWDFINGRRDKVKKT